ncbi:hypothetical protein PROPEN_00016 [Proteus penneri ATCC 35198]|nr:hypothetical protein PROPEN_00016 [Proteus penneri ATCC 35198]
MWGGKKENPSKNLKTPGGQTRFDCSAPSIYPISLAKKMMNNQPHWLPPDKKIIINLKKIKQHHLNKDNPCYYIDLNFPYCLF